MYFITCAICKLERNYIYLFYFIQVNNVFIVMQMLKLVEAMDAFVRMIVIMVFVMGSLQLAGFVRNGKSVQAMPQVCIQI